MRVIQISKAGSGAPNVFIEAGIHAREWISPAMATYLIDSLLNNDANGFKDNLNFHILIRLQNISISSFQFEQVVVLNKMYLQLFNTYIV